MTRIVAGSARGRHLAVPSKGTRPTSDRVREAVFSSLEAHMRAEGLSWTDIHAIDAYAGSGALGLEALSRGAAGVVLIERSRPAADIIRRNIEAVGLPGAQVVIGAVGAVARQRGSQPPSWLILLDPPYDVSASLVARELADFGASGWLTGDALAVVERPASDATSPFPDAWNVMSQRRYGDTVVWYGRRVRAAEEDRDA